MARRPWWETWTCSTVVGAGGLGRLIRRCTSSDVVATQTEYDADEPNPAPTGKVDRAVKLNVGLKE